MQQFSPHRQGW